MNMKFPKKLNDYMKKSEYRLIAKLKDDSTLFVEKTNMRDGLFQLFFHF